MARNFRITEDTVLFQGGAKTKARNNIAAIKLLKSLELETTAAEAREQAILAQYIGWGGIPQIFNPTPDSDWVDLAAQLREILEPAEYNSAFESVLNAHYTSPTVIREIYTGLEHLGFTGGRILEPSMGVGNFLGLLPEEIERRSEVIGIELDSITGRIAKQLYPNHDIYVQGFEKTALPNDYFDLAISNVPFGDYKISDPEYNNLDLKIHNYFFARSLDRVRPGGLVCFVTSTGTMQSQSGESFRAWMSERANLVGAMRLPGNAFKENAGTEVTTDLIILQKIGPLVQSSQESWIGLANTTIQDADGNALQTNEYYARHPKRMLGTLCDDKLHPGRLALRSDGRSLPEAMRDTFQGFPAKIYTRNNVINPFSGEADRFSVSEDGTPRKAIPPEHQSSLKNYGYLAHEGTIWQRQGSWIYQTALKEKTAQRVSGMLDVRDAVQNVFDVQLRGGTDAQLNTAQDRLNQVYDGFVKKFGNLSDTANTRAFNTDPDAQLLVALERKNKKTKEIEKADVFSRRTVRPRTIKDSAQTAQEALLTSLNEYGRVVPGYMGQLLGVTEDQVLSDLQGQSLIYLDPILQEWQTQDQYLSGNVREKLKLAQTAVSDDVRFQTNVQALEAIQPRDLGPGEIEVRLGAPWLTTEAIADFAHHLLELDPASQQIQVLHNHQFALWAVQADSSAKINVHNNATVGTPDFSGLELLELSLNLKDATVYQKTSDGEQKLNQNATLSARMKQQQIQEQFKGWVWQDFDRAEKLCRIYNDLFNGSVVRQFSNPNLEMPGSSPKVELRPHQKDAVWRTLQSESTMLAHVVGSGKTYTMIASAIEMRRLGIAQKPMIVVPNHMLGQFTRELYQLYPNAKVLAPTEKDTQAAKRKELMARIATGDWDAVVVTHSAFVRLPISEDEKRSYYQGQLNELNTMLGDTDVKQGNGIVKQLARERKKLQERIEKISQTHKDDGVTFDQLGIDALFVDEAHFWKNLGRNSKLQNIAGLSNTNSQRAMDAFMKCRIVRANGGRLVFATGTPISNSIAEMYTMQRFLQPDALKRQGIENFDGWVGAFAEKVTAPEIDPTGRFKVKTRLTRFTNVPELMSLFREVADIQTAEQLNLPRPQVERLTITSGASPLQLQYMEHLIERAEAVANRKVEPDEDNMLWVTTDGRRASLDPRLISQSLPDYPESKVNEAIANTHAIWAATGKQKLAQMVFCDLGTPKKAKEGQTEPFSIYKHFKDALIARGVPAGEIAFIHDAQKSADKEDLFAAVREGQVRVLIGSTEKCGVGMNVQDRLIAEHHLDPPWRPSDIEQREGRILRQGNRNPKVLILTYVTQGREGKLGFDSYSWQTLARKAEMVAQVMNGDTSIRSVDDLTSSALSFDEIKAIATGNPLIIEKATVDTRITELSRYKQAFLNDRYTIQRKISHHLPEEIKVYTQQIQQYSEDIERKVDTRGDLFRIKIGAREFVKREDAGSLLQGIMSKIAMEQRTGSQRIGEFAGFALVATNTWDNRPFLALKSPNGMTYTVNGGDSAIGLMRSLEHSISKLDEQLERSRSGLARAQTDVVTLSKNLDASFEYESELENLLVRQQEINAELGINKNDEQAIEATEEPEEASPSQVQKESEKTEESESEALIDLDELVSTDTGWNWENSATWDLNNVCAPSTNLLEALERLNPGQQPQEIAEIELDSKSLLGQVDEPQSEPEQRTEADNDVRAARSRLTGLAGDLEELAEGFDQFARKSSPEREPPRTETTVRPKSSNDSESAPRIDQPTATARNITETGAEPSTERDAEANPSAEPHSGTAERDRTQSQVAGDRFSGIDLQREPSQFVADSDGTERKIFADARTDEREVEQSGSPNQEIQPSPLEQIARGWTDAELLNREQQVITYFSRSLPEPNWSEQQRLIDEVKRCSTENLKISRETKESKAEVEQLGKPRSILHPFGSPVQKVEAAKERYQTSLLKLYESEQHLNQAQSQLSAWQQPAKAYREWRHGSEGKMMHELKAIIELEPIQNRLTHIHAHQKKSDLLEVLGDWEKMAIALGRPDAYVGRIREVTTEFSMGMPVSDKAIDAMRHDNQAFQAQQQQGQQSRKGFSR
jgi:N12 class adenine-specific DNA methylase